MKSSIIFVIFFTNNGSHFKSELTGVRRQREYNRYNREFGSISFNLLRLIFLRRSDSLAPLFITFKFAFSLFCCDDWYFLPIFWWMVVPKTKINCVVLLHIYLLLVSCNFHWEIGCCIFFIFIIIFRVNLEQLRND
jgi:hypothetical protein